jgi:hypothetical protein
VQTYQSTSTPELTWSALAGAVKYDLWIDNRGTSQSQYVRNTNLTGTSWTSPAELPMGAYRAWIRGIDAGGVAAQWSVFVDFIVLPTVMPISPLNSTFDLTPTFTWNPVLGAAGYDLVLKNANTGVVVSNPQNIVGTSWTQPADLPIGLYRWSVVAVSPAAQRSQVATIVEFFVGGQATLLTPSGTTSNRTPLFSWRPVDGAVRYELYVTRTDVPVAGIINQTALTATSYTPTAALPAGTYRAWLRAVGTNGAGPWSAQVNFTITNAKSPRRGSVNSTESLQKFPAHLESAMAESQQLKSLDGNEFVAGRLFPESHVEHASVSSLHRSLNSVTRSGLNQKSDRDAVTDSTSSRSPAVGNTTPIRFEIADDEKTIDSLMLEFITNDFIG